MFQDQAADTDDGWSPVSEKPRQPTRRQRLADRRARDRSQYEERKAGLKCTRCGVDSPDAALCPECLATERARTKSAIKQLRATRRARKQCVRCGAASDRYECLDCLRRVGRAPIETVTPTVTQYAPISHGAIHAARSKVAEWTVEGDGRRRRRGRGRGTRGHPSRADVDAFDVRIMRAELDRAEVALAAYHGDENQERPRIQREEPLREALGHLDLLRRQLEEFEDRASKRLR